MNVDDRNNLRLQNQRLKKEIRDLLAVGEIARTITSTLLIEEVLRHILNGIRRVLALDRVLLGLINSEKQVEEVKLAIGVRGINLQDACWKVSKSDPVWKRLLGNKSSLIIQSSDRFSAPEFISRAFTEDFVKVPMVVKGEIIGTIMGERVSSGISSRDVRLLEICAEYAGIAIENGRLYYDVIRSEEELRKAQTQLVEAERMAVIGQVAVSIKHEINNPLCNISLMAQMLRRTLQSKAPDLLPLVENMDQNVQRIQQVTEKISGLKNSALTEYLPNQLMIDLK